MSELFTGASAPAADREDVESFAGDDYPAPVSGGGVNTGVQSGGATRRSAGFGGAAVKKDTAGKVMRGKGPVVTDPRRYRYDVTRASTTRIPFEVGRDDRMSAVAAGEMLHDLHVMFDIAAENEDVLYAFDSALWFCHTVNSGSVLVPGRSKFSIPGVTQEFEYKVVLDKLGVDARRFFRAFSDDIIAVNKLVLREYNPHDPVSAEKWGWLQQVAHNRGLHRFPHLAHDSADAGLRLTTVERAALAESKRLVISTTNNSADKLRANSRISSADGYDSTVGNNE